MEKGKQHLILTTKNSSFPVLNAHNSSLLRFQQCLFRFHYPQQRLNFELLARFFASVNLPSKTLCCRIAFEGTITHLDPFLSNSAFRLRSSETRQVSPGLSMRHPGCYLKITGKCNFSLNSKASLAISRLPGDCRHPATANSSAQRSTLCLARFGCCAMMDHHRRQ